MDRLQVEDNINTEYGIRIHIVTNGVFQRSTEKFLKSKQVGAENHDLDSPKKTGDETGDLTSNLTKDIYILHITISY